MDPSAWSEALSRWAEHPALSQLLGLALLSLLAALSDWVGSRGVVSLFRRFTQRTQATWDDALVRARVLATLAHLAPALVVFFGVNLVPLHPTLTLVLQRVAVSVIVLVVALTAGALLTALNEIYAANPENRRRPIKGFLQVAKIVVYLIAALLVMASLLDRSPWIFLSGLGAMAAVLLLVFRDTILGLLASLQLTGNDMVHVGDWIEMPQYGADGDVIDVALHTVKVQNWDKTITTIPTHKLIEDSFKNWRGMSRSGGRRIKRAIFIDVSSIRFLDEEDIDRMGRLSLLRDYIGRKREELAIHNAEAGRDPSLNPDIRRLTNLGTLRAYIVSYLRSHPRIHQGMTLIVRQRDPTPHGLPLEIYTFSNDTDWTHYEGIQSDLFDHVFAILPEFGLRAFQSPSGSDIAGLARSCA